MPTRVLSSQDGNKTTVRDLIANPLLVPARIISLLDQAFLSRALLRDEGPNASSLVSYSESTPLYLDRGAEIIGEFAEIPVAAGQKGLPRIAQGTPRGLGVRITKRMRDMGMTGEINRQITQLVNTMVQDDELVLRLLFDNPAIPTIAAGAAWDTSNGKPHKDFARAKAVIRKQAPPNTTNQRFGYKPDTVVIPNDVTSVLEGNDNFAAVFNRDSLVNEDIRYTGKLPNKIAGLDPLESYSFATDRVLVVERQTVGFFSDFQPLEVTELYPEGNGPNGGARQSWRSDATKEQVSGVDQPLAACWITGVVTP